MCYHHVAFHAVVVASLLRITCSEHVPNVFLDVPTMKWYVSRISFTCAAFCDCASTSGCSTCVTWWLSAPYSTCVESHAFFVHAYCYSLSAHCYSLFADLLLSSLLLLRCPPQCSCASAARACVLAGSMGLFATRAACSR